MQLKRRVLTPSGRPRAPIRQAWGSTPADPVPRPCKPAEPRETQKREDPDDAISF
jgi:hypothetical protein